MNLDRPELNAYFEILGLDPDSPFDVVKARYRKLALLYHPDKHELEDKKTREEFTERFKNVDTAFRTIQNAMKEDSTPTFVNHEPIRKRTVKDRFEEMAERMSEINKIHVPSYKTYDSVNINEPVVPLLEVLLSGTKSGVGSTIETKINIAYYESVKRMHTISSLFGNKYGIEDILRKTYSKINSEHIDRARTITEKITIERFAESIVYAQLLQKNNQWSKTDTLDIAEILSEAKTQEQMLVAAAFTRAILADDREGFSELYRALVPHTTKNNIPALMNIANIVFKNSVPTISFTEQCDIISQIIPPLLERYTPSTSEEMLSMPILAIKSSFLKVINHGFKERYCEFIDHIDDFKKKTGYDTEDVLSLMNILDSISLNRSTRFGTLRTLKAYTCFLEGIAATVPKASLKKACEFSEDIAAGCVGYISSEYGKPEEEWLNTFNDYLQFYIDNRDAFRKAMEALNQLKIGRNEEVETYPGIIKLPVKYAAYAGKEIVEMNITGLEQFLQGYRKSNIFRHRQRKPADETGLSYKQKEAYHFLEEIRRGRKEEKIPQAKMSSADVDRLLLIYTS